MSRLRKPRYNPLIRSFMDEMVASGNNLTSLSRTTGINNETMSIWGLRGQPRLDTFDRAVQAIGCRLVIRKRSP